MPDEKNPSQPVPRTRTPDQTTASSGTVKSHDDSHTEQAKPQTAKTKPVAKPVAIRHAHTAALAIAHLAPIADSEAECLTSASSPRSQFEEDLSLCPAAAKSGDRRPGEASIFAKTILHRRKKEVVDRLMAAVLDLLDQTLGPFDDDLYDEEGGGSGGGGRGFNSGRAGTTRSLAGQKRGLHGDDQDDSNEGEEGNGNDGDRIKKRTKTDSDYNRLKFACPYYKRDPEKFKNCRTCCGPGWDEFHRVKEHLLRSHKLPEYKCGRCFQLFKKKKPYDEHIRSATPCEVKDWELVDPIEGFTEEQEKRIRSRKQERKSDADKWRDLYRVLFPLDETDKDIPSPYYDLSEDSRACTQGATSFQRGFRQFLRQQLPPRVRRKIEVEIERQMDGVEDKLKDRLVDMVQEATLQLLTSYSAKFASTPSPAAPGAPGGLLEGPSTLSPAENLELLSPATADSLGYNYLTLTSHDILSVPLDFIKSALPFSTGPYAPFDPSQLVGPYAPAPTGHGPPSLESSLASSSPRTAQSDLLYLSGSSRTSVGEEEAQAAALADLFELEDEAAHGMGGWKGKAVAEE